MNKYFTTGKQCTSREVRLTSIGSQEADQEADDAVEQERHREPLAMRVEQILQEDDADVNCGDHVDDQ